ncbi:MAG TPA: hypothetical protein VHC19_16105, partial [Pirellulales bacterium]|nr:hypothetical protein [Pirellulales bacterium]
SGKLTDEQRRRQVKRISSDLEGPLNKYAEQFFAKLAAAPGADRWLTQMLLARVHVARGWNERGGGYADTVTEQGWRGFGAHLSKARSFQLQAWQERPDLPESALDQIAVTMGVDGVAGEDVRFWLDRAVEADFDLPEAYRAALWAYRPRWGGSYQEMLEFGRECLQTKRFDTEVPWQFHKAVCDVLSEVRDPREACRAIGVYDDYLALLAGSRTRAEDDDARRRFDTCQACIAWLSGRDDEARRLLKQLGDDVVIDVFGDFHVTLSDARLALAGGKRAPPGERWLSADVEQIRFAAGAKLLVGFGTFSGLRGWDLSDGAKLVVELPTMIEGQLMRDADVSPDGKLLAIILMDEEEQNTTGSVVLWDVAAGKVSRTLPAASQEPAYHVRFSPDGKRLAAGMIDGGVTIWDVESGERPQWGYWSGHTAWVQAAAFTADGKRLATAGADWNVKIWDLPDSSGESTEKLASQDVGGPFAGMPVSLGFSPDGRKLLIGHDYCELWDLDVRKLIRQLRGSWVSYAGDGLTLATGGGELTNAARVWDAESGQERARLIGGHHFKLTALVYSPNGRRIITGSADPACQSEGVIRCWDATTGEEVFDFSGCFD